MVPEDSYAMEAFRCLNVGSIFSVLGLKGQCWWLDLAPKPWQ